MARNTSRKPKKKHTITDAILTIILIAAVGVFCYAGYNLIHIYLEYKKGVDEYNKIADMVVTEQDPDAPAADNGEGDIVDMETLKPPMKIDFETLKRSNEDVIGWIYVEAIDTINYPIVSGRYEPGTENNVNPDYYYLHRTYQGTYNFAGTIFIDHGNAEDFTDCNTVVYGHNMKNGSMFGMLKHFTSDPDTYNKSKYFWIFTPEAACRYEIISAYTTGAISDTYTLFKGPGTEFEEYLKMITSKSELAVKTDPQSLSIKDRIVTLSTCTGDYSTRYVVQGKLVNTIPNV